MIMWNLLGKFSSTFLAQTPPNLKPQDPLCGKSYSQLSQTKIWQTEQPQVLLLENTTEPNRYNDLRYYPNIKIVTLYNNLRNIGWITTSGFFDGVLVAGDSGQGRQPCGRVVPPTERSWWTNGQSAQAWYGSADRASHHYEPLRWSKTQPKW